MRTSNSLKNAIVAAFMNIIIILIGFIFQKVFVVTLGNEYLGINGLFNNILSILGIVELGFGSAIVYHLYKPIAENNEEEINVLMKFYKKTYNIIAFVIFLLGIAILPFIKFIVGEVSINGNLHFLFILALIDIVASYLLTYKRSILYADQKTYITNLVHIGYVILMNLVEIIFLLIFHNYELYLCIKIIFRILENIVITLIVNSRYPYITKKANKNIDENIKLDITKKVKGLLFHKIGGSIVLGTDNIIISKMCGIVSVGLYSNYNLIINAVSNLFGQVFSSITATIGNLLVEKNKKKLYNVYKNILFINSWIYSFAGVCILCLIEPFVSIWLGKEYLLPFNVIVVLVLNFYVQGMRRTSNLFKEASGTFYEDRFVPLFESLVNIVASVALCNLFGLTGVFIGTVISTLVLFLYSYPIFVYKKIFNRKYSSYIKEHLSYLVLSILVTVITAILINFINVSNLYLQLCINAIICIIVPNIIYIIIFRKSDELKYYISILKEILNKIKNKKNSVIK